MSESIQSESANTVEDRLQCLEQDLVKLKIATASEYSAVLPIAAIVGGLIYITVIARLPLPGDAGFGMRLVIGLGSAYAGLSLLGMSLEFVKASFKAIVEIAMCMLSLGNMVAGAFLWSAYSSRHEFPLFGTIADEEMLFGVALFTAVMVFILNVLALLVLYPLARTAGTDLEGTTGPDLATLWQRFRR